MKKYNYIIIPIISFFLLLSCNKGEGDNIEIELKHVEVYLKMPPNSDATMPPAISFKFKLKNLTQDTITFITRSSANDSRKSRLLMLDTLNNKIFPIYSNSIPVVKGGDSSTISGNISVREIGADLKLDRMFLDKIDFSKDSAFLSKITNTMINNSIIIYVPDHEDTKKYALMNMKLSKLNPSIIKIKKPLLN